MSLRFEDRFHLESVQGIWVVTPHPTILSLEWDVIEQAADTILAACGQTAECRLLFDLTEVEYFGSIFISLLLRCSNAVKQRGGRFGLCGVQMPVLEMLQIGRLDRVFPIYPNRKTALAELQSRASDTTSADETGFQDSQS